MTNVIPASRLEEKRRERYVLNEMKQLQQDWDELFCRELFALIRGDMCADYKRVFLSSFPEESA